jgi:cytochrome c-type biogenesis protein CcmH
MTTVSETHGTVTRRAFLMVAGSAPLLVVRGLGAQEVPGASMSGDGYLPVRREPKPGAAPSMTDRERDVLERQLACPCPCTMDIFTCRTSMPSCGFSPRIHRDVVLLIEGGYTGDEILAAFEAEYGDHIRMAPPKRGFNLVGWITPFAAMLVGAIALLLLLRSWRRPAAAGASAGVTPIRVSASEEELARLEAAVRRDDA